MIDRKRFAVALAGGLAALSGRASAQSAAPYKLGVTVPLTGALAETGAHYVPSVQISADHVNRAGGV